MKTKYKKGSRLRIKWNKTATFDIELTENYSSDQEIIRGTVLNKKPVKLEFYEALPGQVLHVRESLCDKITIIK